VVTLEAARGFAEAASSVFAIVNPIGGLPIFVALTEDVPKAERRHLFRLAGVAALAVGRVMQIFTIAIGVKFCFRAAVTVFPGLGH